MSRLGALSIIVANAFTYITSIVNKMEMMFDQLLSHVPDVFLGEPLDPISKSLCGLYLHYNFNQLFVHVVVQDRQKLIT